MKPLTGRGRHALPRLRRGGEGLALASHSMDAARVRAREAHLDGKPLGSTELPAQPATRALPLACIISFRKAVLEDPTYGVHHFFSEGHPGGPDHEKPTSASYGWQLARSCTRARL